MTITTTKCDNCGIEKKDSNNWYLILVPNPTHNAWIKLSHDTVGYTGDGKALDACGEECATKLIWENMKK